MSLFPSRSPGASVKVSRLSENETAELTKCETVIAAHVAGYAKVGMALAIIQQKQLYRAEFESFEAYASSKWQMTSQHAHRLIAAAGVHANVSPTGSAPANERQARPLTALPANEQVEVWNEVVEVAAGETITHDAVQQAVDKRKKKTRRSKLAKQISFLVPGARVIIIPNKAFRGYDLALTDALQKAASKKAA